MLFPLVISLLIQTTLAQGTWISVDNGGDLGEWGLKQECPPGTSASGFSIKVQQPTAKSGDNTALNAIRLYCTFPDSQDKQETITSTVGGAGTWGDEYWCPSGNLKYFILRVQAPQDEGDDTAANNILMICSDSTVLEPKGGQLGTFGKISGKCSSGICAIQTRLEPSQGPEEDDTQLNDVKFRCC